MRISPKRTLMVLSGVVVGVFVGTLHRLAADPLCAPPRRAGAGTGG